MLAALIATLALGQGAAPAAPIIPQRKPITSVGMSIDGTLSYHWICGDGEHSTCGHDPIYAVTTREGRRYEIKFDPKLRESLIDPLRFRGEYVRVRVKPGHPLVQPVPVDQLSVIPKEFRPQNHVSIQSMTFNRSASRRPHHRLGNKPFVTILAKFTDTPTETRGPGYYVGMQSNTAPGYGHWFRNASYDRMNIDGSIVVGWVTLPGTADSYRNTNGVLDYGRTIQDAINAVDANVDFTQFYGINVMVNADIGGGIWGLGGQPYFTIDGQSRNWGGTLNGPVQAQYLLVHEMGHALGLGHASDQFGNEYGSVFDPMGSGGFTPPGAPYGYQGAHYHQFHKYYLGWIQPNEIFNVFPGTTQTIRLERRADPVATGYRMIRLFYGGWASRFLTLEAIKGGTNEDRYAAALNGVVVADVNRSRPQNIHAIDADANNNLEDEGSTLRVGETHTDSAKGVTVTVVSEDATGYNVRVTINATSPAADQISNTNDAGANTLREAMWLADELPSRPPQFRLPTSDPNYNSAQGFWRIPLSSALPEITNGGLTVDGGTQTSFGGNTNPIGPEIFIDGTNAGDWTHGFVLKSGNNVLKNLVIGNFKLAGVWVEGTMATGNRLEGNFLGLHPDGTTDVGNGWDGVVLIGGATNNTIGGTSAAQRNVLSGNGSGIVLDGPTTRSNRILGNYIGTNALGTAATKNDNQGIRIYRQARENTVGGTGAGERNLISGNGGQGVAFWDDGSQANSVIGNWIGLNAAGTAALANGGSGVGVYGGAGNRVLDNIISGNGGDGVQILGTVTRQTEVKRNRIGTSADGLAMIGNRGTGVGIAQGTKENLVGGVASERNVIVGSGGNGVGIWDAGSTNNRVRNNYIGVGPSGEVQMANHAGVLIANGASQNTVDFNVITGNRWQQVLLIEPNTNQNTINDNRVGLTPSGADFGEGFEGITMWRGPSNNLILSNIVARMGRGILVGTGNGEPAPQGNSILRNLVFRNGWMNIDIDSSDRVQPNDLEDADTGPNDKQNSPELTGAIRSGTSFVVSGQMLAKPSRNYIIQFFASNVAHPSGSGDAEQFLGQITATSNELGDLSISATLGGKAAPYVVALATDEVTGDTGELSAPITVPNGLIRWSLREPVITSGTLTRGDLELTYAAIANTSVAMASNSNFVTVPQNVTVPTGSDRAEVNITSLRTSVVTDVQITATLNGQTLTQTLRLNPSIEVSDLRLNVSSVAGGNSVTGTVTINWPAPQGGAFVALSDNSAVTGIPASVIVPEGRTTETFAISTAAVNSTQTATITATKVQTRSVNLTIVPADLLSVSVRPSVVFGGMPSTGTLTLTGLAGTDAARFTVALAVPTGGATVPSSVVVASGRNSASFTISTQTTSVDRNVTVQATHGSIVRTATLGVRAPILVDLLIQSPVLRSRAYTPAWAVLSGPSGSPSLMVRLTSVGPVTVPRQVFVPAGSDRSKFNVFARPVAVMQLATIRATLNGVTQTRVVVVTR